MTRILALISCPALLLCGCTTPNSGPVPGGEFGQMASTPVNTVSNIIAVGDNLEVYVIEDDSFTGRYLVRSGGNIIIPRVGRVQVAGRSLSDAESAIKSALESNQLRSATVMVEREGVVRQATSQSVGIFVSGTVGTPGRRSVPYFAGRPPTISQAILESGGFRRYANRKAVQLRRTSAAGAQESYTVDVEAIMRGSETDVPLRDGDIIYVPERGFGW